MDTLVHRWRGTVWKLSKCPVARRVPETWGSVSTRRSLTAASSDGQKADTTLAPLAWHSSCPRDEAQGQEVLAGTDHPPRQGALRT